MDRCKNITFALLRLRAVNIDVSLGWTYPDHFNFLNLKLSSMANDGLFIITHVVAKLAKNKNENYFVLLCTGSMLNVYLSRYSKNVDVLRT